MLAERRRVPERSVGDLPTDDHRGQIEIVPFAAWHLDFIDVQEDQKTQTVGYDYAEQLQFQGPAYTLFADSRVIACCGVIRLWETRYAAWALLSREVDRYSGPLHRGVVKFLRSFDVVRLECTVDPRSVKAVEWAKRLGFTCEGLMKKYAPGGTDMLMFARVK